MLKNFVERLMSGLLYEEPGDGGGGGGTGDGGTSVADNNGATKPGENDGTRQPDNGGKPAQARAQAEDPRIKGLLADLKKEREARQRFERDHSSATAELERERKRVLALSGIEPKSKEDEDIALVRERLEKIYPWMKNMTDEKLQALDSMNGTVEEMRNATTTQWKAHGQKMLTTLKGSLQKALGGGKLSDRQSARIQEAYVGAARSNPDFLSRHESGDPALIEEFVKEWVEDFVEPGRRSALQTETQSQRRPRVPGGKDRSIVGANDKPIDVKDNKAVEDMLVQSFRAKGGQFGRR